MPKITAKPCSAEQKSIELKLWKGLFHKIVLHPLEIPSKTKNQDPQSSLETPLTF